MLDETQKKLIQLALGMVPVNGILPGESRWVGKRDAVEELVAEGLRQGLGGILYRRLEEGGSWENMPLEQRERLRQVYYAGVGKNVRLQQALLEILERANALNLRIVLLQGISLLDDVYADIGLRALTDIDLWVLPDDFPRFSDILSSLGYRHRKPYKQVFFRDGICIDVHTHLLWAERIKSRSKLLQLSQSDIFYAAQKLDFKGTTAYRLNATDQFVYLSLHSLKHFVQRLIWLVDLVSLSQNWTGKDWFALQQRAGELGQTRTVQYILYLLENLAAYRPTKVSDLFQEPPLKAWEKAILDIRKGKGRLPAWAPVALLPASLTPARRARFVFENIFPDPPVLREVFSSRSDLKNWQLYGLRALQLMGAKKPD